MRHRVCAAAGDEQQLQELQAALRTELLQEVAYTRATQRLNDATQHSDASLQFAWETIQEQKKEVVRLRAENQELKSRKPPPVTAAVHPSASRSLDASLFFNDEPASAIRLLRSQLSSHHDTNLSLLHDYITRLEDALRRATTGEHSARESSGLTFDSSRGGGDGDGDEKENWRPLFPSSMLARDDFSRTQPTGRQRSCEPCKRSAVTTIALQSEAKQLRAQVAADEESLVRAEKEQLQLKREQSALTSALLSAKQQHEELRQMVLDITHEKHELQSQREAEVRASERTVRLLRDQLDGVSERNRRQARHLERLELERDNEDRNQRSFSTTRRAARTEDYERTTDGTTSVLRERIRSLQSEIVELEALASEDKREINELRAAVDALKQATEPQGPTVAQVAELREKEDAIEALKQTQASYEVKIESYRQQHAALESRADSLQRALSVRDDETAQRDATIAELKQDKRVLVSLQKAEQERSRFHQDELGKAREECGFLKQRVEAATSDCEELRRTLQAERSHSESVAERFQEAEDALKRVNSANAALKRELRDADDQLQGFEDGAVTKTQLQSELEKVKRSHAVQTEELATANERLRQEIADSKTTILMWMSKYNALSEHVSRLEADVQCAAEDRYSLQREIESLTADHERQLQDERRRSEANKADELSTLRATTQTELQRSKQTLSSQFEAKIAELEKRTREQQLQAHTLQSDLSRSRISNVGELAQLRASTLELESHVSVLEDANRALQNELRSEQRQRKTLGLLVETLQERPVLQRRALHEMLSSSQRQLEFVFVQLMARVEETGRKLVQAEHTCESLRSHRSARQRFESVTDSAVLSSSQELPSSVDSTHQDAIAAVVEPCARGVRQLIKHLAERTQCAALAQLSRVESDHDAVQRAEVVLVDALCRLDRRDDVLVTSTSAAQQEAARQTSAWKRAAALLRWRFLLVSVLRQQHGQRTRRVCLQMTRCWVRTTTAVVSAAQQVVRWKWRYVVLGVAKVAVERTQHEQLATARTQWRWQSLARYAEKQRLQRTMRVLTLQTLRQHKLSNGGTRRRASESKILKLELEVASLRERAAALSPVSTVALGNCVRLLQKFCDDTETPADVGASRATLTRYLIESNCKIAGWRRTIDRKIEEFSDRKEQLQRLQDRCTEMKELVALNQRLVHELERKAAGQQAVVDAACAFTRAYKTLRMSVSSQMFKTNEFYAACKRIVEVVHVASAPPGAGRRVSASLSVVPSTPAAPAPAGVASSTPGAVSGRRLVTLNEESELTTSQAAASSKLVIATTGGSDTSARCRTSTLTRDSGEDVERRRRASRARSEQAVVLLKSANEIRARLEHALAERTRSLHHALAQLETKRLQFVVLRSFLRWKFATYTLRMQEQRVAVRP